MSIEVEFYLREGQNSPLSSVQVDENFKRIKAAFSQAIVTAGSVSSVSASVFTGLSVSVSNPTTTPAIAITTTLNGFLKGNGSGFTAQASINLGSDVSAILPIANGGLGNNSFTANRVPVYNGLYFETSSTTTTQLGYLNNVSSDIQTQLNGKKANFSVLPYAEGGTNYQASSRQDLINNLTASSAATTGYVLTRDSSGDAVWAVNAVSGVSSLNGLTGAITLTVSNTVNPYAWSGANLNIPTATSSVTGLLSSADWTTFNSVTTKLSLTGGTITGPILYSGFPATGDELVNLNYITSVLNGLKYVSSANAATTANVTIASAPAAVDGVTLALNNRVLIWQQTDPTENGVYIFNGAASPFTRATDADSSSELNALTIFIQSGTVNGNHTYTQTTPNPVVGTDDIVFVLSATSGTYTQGTGISIVANVVSLDVAYTDTLYTSKTLTSANIYVGNGSNVATAVAMSGEASIDNAGAVTLSNAAVIAKVLTGFTSGAGTVTAADSILSAFQKINGNVAAIVSSPWVVTGSDIYYNAGKVGVATSTPLSSFHNNGSLSLSKATSIPTGNYTVLDTDFYLDCVQATVLNTDVYTIPLSTVVGLGKIYIFNHPYPTTINGGAGGGNATLQLSGSDKFNDGSGLLNAIVIKYGECITLYSNGNGTWTYWVSFSVINFSTNNYFDGVLPFAYGGTGLSVLGTAGQQLRVNAGATALEYFTFALSNGSGTTANGIAVDLGGTLNSAATISSNAFDITIAHSTGSRNTRFSAAGNFQIWNGATSGQTTFEYNPTGFNSLPSVRINPNGATFTQNAVFHIYGESTSSSLVVRVDNSAGTQLLGLTQNGTLNLPQTVTFTVTGNAGTIVNTRGLQNVIQSASLGNLPYLFGLNTTSSVTAVSTTETAAYNYMNNVGSIIGNNIADISFSTYRSNPTYALTGTTSGVLVGFYHNPIITSLASVAHRAWWNTTGDMIVGSTSGNLGIGTTAVTTGRVNIAAGTTSLAPLQFTSGPLTTGGSIVAGQIQFLTDDFYATITTGTAVHKIARILVNTATLDFPSTPANGQSDLTITVTGAVAGDAVSIAVPNASATTGTFWGWVSAADTVTIRFHNTSGGSVDPASGTFKAVVIKN